ncbi:AAA family ATPase [Candidatus Poriferisodalis sp.]|uniref:AAA family ATPase n=1 Tax=Candidatus Poriferisodalis sp. TaxID=3101277 RepID=UPI003B02585A
MSTTVPAVPEFRFRNLGPIAEGTIQLRPLTILIGKNNTGKTYTAQAIYAAYKALERANGPATPPLTGDESFDLISWINHPAEPLGVETAAAFTGKFQTWLGTRLERASRNLADRLAIYFDIENLSELKRWRASGELDIAVHCRQSETESRALFTLSGDHEHAPLDTLDISSLRETRVVELLDEFLAASSGGAAASRSELLQRRAASLLSDHLWYRHLLPASGLGGDAHYLPAGRSGLLEAWTDVVRIRLEQDRDGLALTGREPAALGGIALDFLIELQQLTSPRSERRAWQKPLRRPIRVAPEIPSAATHLERLIGGGVVVARGRERVPSLSYQHGKQVIPVQRASSMVAELAPLIRWISDVLGPGDLLLIDEPEAHMHPEAVLAVAQTLVALSQAGVRVLCTTHSTDFLHQVSNCMLRAAQVPSSGSADAPSISVDDLAVYRFEQGEHEQGSTVSPVEVDPAWGIPEDEYVAVAERLADETAQLLGETR